MVKYIIPVCLLIAWEIIARILNAFYFPPASVAAIELYNQVLHGPVISDTLISASRLGLASVIAIPLTLLFSLYIGYNSLARELSLGIVKIMRALPSSALIPVIILMAGITYKSSIILLVYVIMVPLMISAIDSISHTANTYKPLIENLELPTYDAFKQILIPGSMPGILSGIDTSITVAFKFLIVVEMFGTSGLGFRISNSADQMAYVTSYALLIWVSILGIMLFSWLEWAKRKIVHWV